MKENRGFYYLFIIQSVFWLATNIVAPFLSIFLIDEYGGVEMTEFGISSMIYFLAFGLFLPIVGRIEENQKGFRDELMFLNWGLITRGLLFILLASANGVWALYIIQFFLGVSRAFFSPSYDTLLKSFKGKKSTLAYGFNLDESIINIFAAVGSGVSGYLASVVGVRTIILSVGIVFVLATVFSLPLVKNALKKM